MASILILMNCLTCFGIREMYSIPSESEHNNVSEKGGCVPDGLLLGVVTQELVIQIQQYPNASGHQGLEGTCIHLTFN